MMRTKNFIAVNMKDTRAGRKRLVLEAIPYDKWVSAREIASKVGLTPKSVGIIIGWHLIPYHVEKKVVDARARMSLLHSHPL